MCRQTRLREYISQLKTVNYMTESLKCTVCVRLSTEKSPELGRITAFTPGIFERESIFPHAEFKYLLSMLDVGLYEELFERMRTVLPPFFDPEIYGRSTLENSSYIVSSTNPDPELAGRGFVPAD